MSNYKNCKAKTTKGINCSRIATKGGYCTQHYNLNNKDKQTLDVNNLDDVFKNIISDYIEYDQLKELQTKFNEFKLNSSRVIQYEENKENENINTNIIQVDDKIIKKEIYKSKNLYAVIEYHCTQLQVQVIIKMVKRVFLLN